MEKILLINPCWDYIAKGKRHNRIWPPLDLLNCASLLERDGFQVSVLDANAERIPVNKIVEFSQNFLKIFVTSSSLDRWQCPNLNIKPILKLTQALNKKNLYVMGAHGTVNPHQMLDLTKAKAIIIGEPELKVLEIANDKPLEKIKGVAYYDGNKLIITGGDKPLNLELLPIPAFHLLKLERYYYELLGKDFVILEASRGCPFSCVYCLKEMYGNTYRKKSAEQIIKEVDHIVNNHAVKNIYFIDLEFTLNRQTVQELCDHLINKRYDLKWCCQTRADSVDNILLRKMKEAGCVLIHYGVETGSDRIMKMINKNISLSDIKNGIRITKKEGIETACFFMFGFPTETIDEMRITIEFAKRLNPTYASFHTATIYPGTNLSRMVGEKPKLPYNEAYTKEHSLQTLKSITRKAFIEFYIRPSYILSRLKSFNILSWSKQIRLFYAFIRGSK